MENGELSVTTLVTEEVLRLSVDNWDMVQHVNHSFCSELFFWNLGVSSYISSQFGDGDLQQLIWNVQRSSGDSKTSLISCNLYIILVHSIIMVLLLESDVTYSKIMHH